MEVDDPVAEAVLVQQLQIHPNGESRVAPPHGNRVEKQVTLVDQRSLDGLIGKVRTPDTDVLPRRGLQL